MQAEEFDLGSIKFAKCNQILALILYFSTILDVVSLYSYPPNANI